MDNKTVFKVQHAVIDERLFGGFPSGLKMFTSLVSYL
jgi:hypothetical protein